MSQKRVTKQAVIRFAWKYLLIFIGSGLLALGDAAFLVPFNLVTGGVVSIGIILQHYVGSAFQVTDIVTWVVQIAMMVVSFFFLGKKFTIRTAVSVLLYPLLFSFMLRVPLIDGKSIGDAIANLLREGTGQETLAADILAAVFGGACVGGGVGVCYLAGGSTGGLDVISVILYRKARIKESVSSFVIDASILLVGFVCMQNLVQALIGIVSALICALMVQYLYVRSNGYVIADIISDKTNEIKAYVEQVMDRTTTLISAVGGYTGEKRTILRVALERKELLAFRTYVAEVDPKAFCTLTEATMIRGEGFQPLTPSRISKITNEDPEIKNDEEKHG